MEVLLVPCEPTRYAIGKCIEAVKRVYSLGYELFVDCFNLIKTKKVDIVSVKDFL